MVVYRDLNGKPPFFQWRIGADCLANNCQRVQLNWWASLRAAHPTRWGFLPRALSGVFVLWGVVLLLDRAFPPPMAIDAHSVEVLDASGERLRLYTTADGFWRLPADPGAVDPGFLELLLAFEDKRFAVHAGIDPLALGRALGQALRQGRFVSGGSTLTMQTVRLLRPRPRTLGVKLLEMACALQLERRLTKGEILGLYLTLAPYGGNIQGVRAASLFYFGKEPSFLTLAEAALLVALPQSPERRRPDRHPRQARRARDAVLERLVRSGAIAAAAAATAMAEPVPRRRHATPRLAPHLADRLRARQPRQGSIRTSLDGRLQRKLEALIGRHQVGQGEGITLAAVILDNRDASVRAYVGSGDYFGRRFPGQVDMVRALRSPGSALKPFVYGLGFDAGFLHPETLIADRPGAVGGYAPDNFDHRYRGEVSVREALRSSRNIPAIKVLQRLGPERLVDALERSGVELRLPGAVRRAGLPVALGGAGISLEELTMLYGALAHGGEVRQPRLLAGHESMSARRLLSATAAWYLTDILRGSPLPGGFVPGEGRIAFKTGTSYGFRDAWAVGYDAGHTAGVWIGRPDGGYTPGLSGLHAAVPVLLELFDLLPAAGLAPLLRRRPADLLLVENPELPAALRRFGALSPAAAAPLSRRGGPLIAYPPEGSLVELAGEAGAAVQLQAAGGEPPFHWLVNGRYFATETHGKTLQWTPAVFGSTRLTVIDSRGRSHSVGFRVQRSGVRGPDDRG